jgi:hypothetical protein
MRVNAEARFIEVIVGSCAQAMRTRVDSHRERAGASAWRVTRSSGMMQTHGCETSVARWVATPGDEGQTMAKEKAGREDPFQSTEKVMQTFRMTRELVAFLKTEASAKGLDLTAYVNRMLEGLRTWFGLPDAASHLLEADREALKMGRYEYILHVLFQRSLELREKGAGFDAPGAEKKKR